MGDKDLDLDNIPCPIGKGCCQAVQMMVLGVIVKSGVRLRLAKGLLSSDL